MTPTTMLELIGLRPIVVPQLGRRSIMLQDYNILLVDAEADLEEVADWALSEAARLLSEVTR